MGKSINIRRNSPTFYDSYRWQDEEDVGEGIQADGIIVYRDPSSAQIRHIWVISQPQYDLEDLRPPCLHENCNTFFAFWRTATSTLDMTM